MGILESVKSKAMNNKSAIAMSIMAVIIVALVITIALRETMIPDGPNYISNIGGTAKNRTHQTSEHNNAPWEQEGRSVVNISGYKLGGNNSTELEHGASENDDGEMDMASSGSSKQNMDGKADLDSENAKNNWILSDAGNSYAQLIAEQAWSSDVGDSKFMADDMPNPDAEPAWPGTLAL